MQGLHITGDLFNCSVLQNMMVDLDTIRHTCLELTKKSSLTAVDDKFYVFPEWQGEPGGVTGTVLLAESHLCVHTWPERNGVTLDVYVCNFTQDNSAKAENLFYSLVEVFNPKTVQVNRIQRAEI